MFDEDLYWKIVDTSLKNSSNQKEQKSFLIAEISNLIPMEMDVVSGILNIIVSRR